MLSLNTNYERFNLDPRTKIIIMIIVSGISMSGTYEGMKFLPRFMISIIPIILLALSNRFNAALVLGGIFVISGFLEFHNIFDTKGILNLVLVMFSGIISRFLPALIMGYYFLNSTSVEQLIAALQQSRVPNFFTIPLAVMFRFFPTIAMESTSISDAMKLRGIKYSAIFKNPVKFLEYRFVPLMTSIVKIGDELSAAALTRGLDAKAKRTSYRQVSLALLDYCCISVLVLLVIFYSVI